MNITTLFSTSPPTGANNKNSQPDLYTETTELDLINGQFCPKNKELTQPTQYSLRISTQKKSFGGPALLWKPFLYLCLWSLWGESFVSATEDDTRGDYSSESWRVVLILTGTVFAIIGVMIIAAAIKAYKRPILSTLGFEDPKVDVTEEEEDGNWRFGVPEILVAWDREDLVINFDISNQSSASIKTLPPKTYRTVCEWTLTVFSRKISSTIMLSSIHQMQFRRNLYKSRI